MRGQVFHKILCKLCTLAECARQHLSSRSLKLHLPLAVIPVIISLLSTSMQMMNELFGKYMQRFQFSQISTFLIYSYFLIL